MSDWTLGMVGVGNMGSALVKGVIGAGLIEPSQVVITDIDKVKTAALAGELGIRAANDAAAVMQAADTIILGVKPQGMKDLLQAMTGYMAPRHLIISIAAGIPLKLMMSYLGAQARLIRVMPNTPAMIGCGAAAVARGGAATDADVARALAIFGAAGVAVEVDESQINAVTGLSGSGPAYVFYMIEALTSAGEKAGLARDVAALLAKQTVLGAARMAMETDVEPAELRRRVTSPNGTTEAGLKIMFDADFMAIIERTVARAAQRGEELGKLFE